MYYKNKHCCEAIKRSYIIDLIPFRPYPIWVNQVETNTIIEI